MKTRFKNFLKAKKNWDDDGDGEVSKEEVIANIKKKGKKKKAKKNWDDDGDGEVSQEEVIANIKKKKKKGI